MVNAFLKVQISRDYVYIYMCACDVCLFVRVNEMKKYNDVSTYTRMYTYDI